MNNVDVSFLNQYSDGHAVLPMRSEKSVMLLPTAATPDYWIDALKPFSLTDYLTLRIVGRGGDKAGIFDPTSAVFYRFLINPSEVQISRTTLDEQSMARSGWQVGVWGEDFISITLNGKTAGKYFSQGLTDTNSPYTMSYRNLLALEVFFENNGYWFEGEEASTALLDKQQSKRIKAHSDVELKAGEFIWHGMFESLEIIEDAESPFLADFSLVFTAWKETFRKDTPYPNSIGGEVQRGHVPMVRITPPATPVELVNSTLTTMIMNPQESF